MTLVNIKERHLLLDKVSVGENVKWGSFINAYGCEIGDNCKVGAFVEIQKGVKIGRNCKISSHSFLCEGVEIKDNVFIGHSVTFINDRYPRATNAGAGLQTEEDWLCENTIVNEGASLGSGVTVLCGISIGKNAIIGAGSVVTKNVEEGVIVAGNPARFIKKIENN